MKLLIIDDEPLARLIIKEYLQAYPEFELLQECGDGFEGLKAIQQHQPDLIFLDIQMPKINGFELLELVEHPPAVIFTTAFDEFAIKAFEAHAVDYLLKPFNKERFDKAIRKWQSSKAITPEQTAALLSDVPQSPAQRQRIVVKTGNKIKLIPLKEIVYLEAADDYVKIHTTDGTFLKNKTMQHFEELLDPAIFIRIHRSYLVNVQQVVRIDVYEKDNHRAYLKNGEKLSISRSGYVRLKKALDI